MTFHVPEHYRTRDGYMATTARDGNNGVFDLPPLDPVSGDRYRFAVIASDGEGWEHVSVHAYKAGGRYQRTPTWDEMCHIKALFWDDDDVVIQYHPSRSEYVNNHQHTLHLWRPIGVNVPTPDAELVGYPDVGVLR